MKTEADHIFVHENSQPVASAIIACLQGQGCRVYTTGDLSGAMEDIEKTNLTMILIDGDAGSAQAVMGKVKSLFPAVPVVVMVSPAGSAEIMHTMRNDASDFILKPVNPAAIELARFRARRLIHLQQELKTAQTLAAIHVPPAQEEQVETERFVAVRQIVDKMSQFMVQLNKDVQGGIQFFNEMPYFVAIHDRYSKVVAANPVYMDLLGKKIGKDSWEIYRGKRASRRTCPVGRTLASGNVLTTRAVVQYLSGARVPVIVRTAPIYNNDGEIELILEVFAGTKEIERMAAEIKTTHQRYEQLFDAVPSYIAVLDRRYRVTAINKRFRGAFGNQVGKRFSTIFIQGKTAMQNSPIRQTLQDGLPHQAEMILTTQAGDQYSVLAWTSPIFTPAGKLIQILVIFLDITELRHLRDNLSSLGMMMGTVSHSLKGSLTGLDAALYLIDTGFYRDKPAKIEEGLDVAKLVIDRIRKLVFDILYYTKDRGLELEQVHVSEFCEDILVHTDQRIRGANIRFDHDFKQAFGVFEIDPGLLRSALTNILENAMEACIEDPTDRGHVIEFTVTAERNYVMFDIRDNGIGMHPDQIKQSFSPFYSTKGKRGTGLGLFITNKVIQKHGGRLTVNSEPGKGSQFQIRLPRSIAGVAR